MRRARLAVFLLGVGLAGGGSHAAARPKQTPLQQLLQRTSLPDAALVLRWVDAEAELISQRVTYGKRHPTLRYTVARIKFLRRAARRAPKGGATAAVQVARGLRAGFSAMTRDSQADLVVTQAEALSALMSSVEESVAAEMSTWP